MWWALRRPSHSPGLSKNTNIPGLVISTSTAVAYELGNTGANANKEQRIRYEFQIPFGSASLASRPPSRRPAARRPTPTPSTPPSPSRGKPSRVCRRSFTCWPATTPISRTSMPPRTTSPTSARICGCSRSRRRGTARISSAFRSISPPAAARPSSITPRLTPISRR